MMKDLRSESKPTGTIHMINYMRCYHHDWVEEYFKDKKRQWIIITSLQEVCQETWIFLSET